jgi:predicted PurR-regulated permease PerM
MIANVKKTFESVWASILKFWAQYLKKHHFEEIIPEWADSEHEDTQHTRSLTSRTAWMFWWIGAMVVLLSYALFQLTTLLYLVITWRIVSLAIERLIQFWQRLWVSRWFALWRSYTILIVFMLSGMIIMVPFVVTQLADLVQMWIQALQNFQTLVQQNWLIEVIQQSRLPETVKVWLSSQANDGQRVAVMQTWFTENISQILSFGGEWIKSAWTFAVSLIDGVFNTILQIGLVITVAIFFSLERIGVLTFIASLTKNPKKTYNLLLEMSTKLGLWLEWQLLLCLIIWLLSAVGLWILQMVWISIPNKFSLALIAWLTEFIPYIWPILWSIPALLVATLAFGRKWFIAVWIVYWAIQFLENNVIVPAVMSQKLWVNPLVIFLCMLSWATLFWFLGILLAVPIAVIVTLLVEQRK